MESSTELWTYAGRVMLRGGKPGHAWIDPNGNELYYDKLTGSALGSQYEVEVTRTDDSVKVGLSPRWVQSSDPNPEWVLRDNATRVDIATRRGERSAAKRDRLDEAMAPLVGYAKTCRTGAERDALVATVVRRLGGIW
jgi:hypothetical protein